MNLPVCGAVILGLLLSLTGIQPVRARPSVAAPLNNATSLPVGSCTSTVPCSNGACRNGNKAFGEVFIDSPNPQSVLSSGEVDVYSDSIKLQQLARTVNIPGCAGLEFKALAYDNASTDEYWDLEFPHALNPSYTTIVQPPAGSSTYAMEHVYEIQLVAQFIVQIYSLTTLWHTPGQPINLATFCIWVDTNILKSTVQDELAKCLPNNGAANGPYMPLLESTANSIKARAFAPKNIFTQPTFDSYTDSEKVSVMRATSGLTVYMNDAKVKGSFISSSDCIRNVWGNVDHTGAIVQLYNAWVVEKLNTFNTQIQTGMTNMLQWWNAVAGSTTSVHVVLGYSEYVTLNPTALNSYVSGQELQTDIVTFATGNPINWIHGLWDQE